MFKATWHWCEPTCHYHEILADRDQRDIWSWSQWPLTLTHVTLRLLALHSTGDEPSYEQEIYVSVEKKKSCHHNFLFFLWHAGLGSPDLSFFPIEIVIFTENMSIFSFFSSDIRWPTIFISFPLTCKKNPCWDPSSVDYNATSLTEPLWKINTLLHDPRCNTLQDMNELLVNWLLDSDEYRVSSRIPESNSMIFPEILPFFQDTSTK